MNEWNPQTDIPDELNKSGNGFSVDVLIYCERLDEHTIGWFDFKRYVWNFLCREPVKDFKWRYLNDNDKPKSK